MQNAKPAQYETKEKIMKISGVYKLQSKCNPERIYIGSSINVRNRISGHFSAMLNGYSTTRLIKHFIEFGRNDFESTIIEECSPQILRKREQYYIDLYNPYFNEKNVDGSTLHARRWESTNQEDYEKLLNIRKVLHKEYLAKHQTC